MAIAMTPTLPGSDYCSPAIFDLDCERILHRQWFYAGRAERLGHVGDRLLVDVGGESILIVRDADGELHAHYNVCRHRGSQLCDASGSGFGAAITCPYHAWSYSLDGRLVATPRVGKDELDRDQFPLRSVAVEDWQGFLFVNLDDDPPSVRDWIADQDPYALAYERLEMDRLRIGHRLKGSSRIGAGSWLPVIALRKPGSTTSPGLSHSPRIITRETGTPGSYGGP